MPGQRVDLPAERLQLLDGREIARTENLAPGALAFTGLMRIGGVVEPRFYRGLMDDLRVTFRPR